MINTITRPPIILIVDDEPDILAILEYFVHQLAPTYDIVTVSDPHCALNQLSHRSVPLLITDYMMPGMNGLQLVAAVKATSPTTHVILATAYGSAALEQRAREHQVDTFLPKTDIPDQLGQVVRHVLQVDGVDTSVQLTQLAQRQYSAVGAPYGNTAAGLLRWVEQRLAPIKQAEEPPTSAE